MNKAFFLLLSFGLLTGCSTLQEAFTGYSEKAYNAKVAEYQEQAPKDYYFFVEKQTPYALVEKYFRIIQVLGKNEVIACEAYSRAWSYEQYKIGRCQEDTYYHMVFADEHKELFDNDNFWAKYFKSNTPYVYTTVMGTQNKIRSFTIKQ